MRFLLSLTLVVLAWSMAAENVAAAPRYPWSWTRFGRLTHAHILAVQAAEAQAAAAAAAAAAQQTALTMSTGMVVVAGAGTITLNTAGAVALEYTGVVLNRVSGTTSFTFNTGTNVVTAANLTVSPLGLTYAGSTGMFSFNNLAIVESTSGTHTTTLNSSGTFTGTLALSGSVATFDITNVTGTLTTDSFSGGTYTGSATLSIASGSTATLTLSDGTIFNLSPAPATRN